MTDDLFPVLPAPPVPAYVSLRGLPYMPLDVLRLRDSDFASRASAEGFRCAVLLWCASWHQHPAASLPDDDHTLAQLAGFGRAVDAWRPFRSDALYGWQLCTDGRLYHPVVAEKALEAWEQRLEHWYRTECARLKKAAQRHGTTLQYPSLADWTARLLATGERQWVTAVTNPGDAPDASRGTPGDGPGDVPGETASKRREREGKGSLDSLSTGAGDDDAPPPTRKVTPTGACAVALNRAGYRVNPHHPKLRDYIEAGGTVEYLVETIAVVQAREKDTGERFNAGYIIAIATREVTSPRPPPVSRGTARASRGTVPAKTSRKMGAAMAVLGNAPQPETDRDLPRLD